MLESGLSQIFEEVGFNIDGVCGSVFHLVNNQIPWEGSSLDHEGNDNFC